MLEVHLDDKCFSGDAEVEPWGVAVAMKAADAVFCGWFLGVDEWVGQVY